MQLIHQIIDCIKFHFLSKLPSKGYTYLCVVQITVVIDDMRLNLAIKAAERWPNTNICSRFVGHAISLDPCGVGTIWWQGNVWLYAEVGCRKTDLAPTLIAFDD